MTTFNPIPDDMPLGQALQMQSTGGSAFTPNLGSFSQHTPSLSPPMTPVVSQGRSMSMMSSSSTTHTMLSAVQPNPFDNPSGPGLRGSITEIVNAYLFGGQVNRIVITGEVALSLKDITPPTGGRFRLRIANFECLEKAAPHRSYLSIIPDQPGEYSVDASALLDASSQLDNPIPVLKYQVHVEASQWKSYIPVEVIPAWKTEPNLTSLIISYRPLPDSKLSASTTEDSSPFAEASSNSAMLRDFKITAPISSNVISSQAKPAGVWSAENKWIKWDLEDLLLSATTQPSKILARFNVDSPSTPQPVTIQWRVPGRLASRVGLELPGNDILFEESVKNVISGKFLASS